MDEKKILQSIIAFCKSLEGQVISTENLSDNMQFIRESKRLASSHEWLYHCTTASNLKSILQKREFWLSNLQWVNDKEEVRRIDVPEYEKTYYVCCCTYDPNVPPEHWEEYGNMTNGVIVALKPDWFLRKAVFMCSDNSKCDGGFSQILSSRSTAEDYKIAEQLKGRRTNPFYINEFGFYQVVYDDDLRKTIVGASSMEMNGCTYEGRTITSAVAGIIKSTHGLCERPGKPVYDKNWTTEKEVRLKIGVQQLDNVLNGNEEHDGCILRDVYFPKIAVPISDDAFSTLRIKFSPEFKDKEGFIKELEEVISSDNIEII